MNDKVKAKLLRGFFNHSSFKELANAIPHGLLVISENGNIIFANEDVQEVCFDEKSDLTPFIHYRELIGGGKKDILEIIDDVFLHKTDLVRQVTHRNKIFLIESKAAYVQEKFAGCTISITDITDLATKEKQHELLYQIASALSGVDNVNHILKVALAQILKAAQINAANIMMYDARSNTLCIKIDSNKHETGWKPGEFKLSEGTAGKCALEQKPYSVYDITESEVYAQRTAQDKGALLSIPIATKGKLLGVLNVWDQTPRYFTESEVQFLTIIANEVAIALENSLLYERLRRRVNHLSKLFWASSFIGMPNIGAKIEKISRLTPDLVEAEGCRIYLYDQTREKLLLQFQSHPEHAATDEIDLRKPNSQLCRDIIYQREPVLCNDLTEFSSVTLLRGYPIYNFIVTPLFIENKSIGVFIAYNKLSGGFITEDEQLLAITAHRISTTLESAKLMQNLESEKGLLDRIIKNTSEGVAVLDDKRKIIVWNRYLEELTGIKSKEVLGMPCYKVLYNKLGLHNLTSGIYASRNQTPDRKKNFTIEEELRDVRGDRTWVAAIYSHIFSPQSEIENTIIVFRKISKDKELMEAKNEFISMTTHELRTPITAVKGYLSMILNGDAGKVTERQQQFFSKAYAATERLSSLVEELLDVTRIDENKIKFSPIEFPAKTMIDECIEGYKTAAGAKNIQIIYDADSSDTVLRADPNRSKQILCNLIDNAVKYTRDKGKVTVSLHEDETCALVEVKDTGVGIPARALESVFDRFIRIPNSLSVRAGGAGLGLYIVKNLVEKQGGRIWVTSQLGKGTTFHFTLPKVATKPKHETKERSLS